MKVLIVDDSPVIREYLTFIFANQPDMEVVGTASDGMEAIEAVQRLKPDVVTMDVEMPRLNGLEAARTIMETTPVPIVIVSSLLNPTDAQAVFQALEAGAVTMVEKPKGFGAGENDASTKQLVQTVRLMAEVKVVKRWPRQKSPGLPAPGPVVPVSAVTARRNVSLLVIGASTGGPPVLQTILAGIAPALTVPVLVVQHISPGFLDGLVEWLNQGTGLPVDVACHNQLIRPGHVYFAPDYLQMGLSPDWRISLRPDPPENGVRPSVSYLFRSVATTCGAETVGMLLTGMGRDGAAELAQLRQRGALTLAQDQDSSTIFGMPGEAVRLNAASLVLPPQRMVEVVVNLLRNGINPMDS